MTGAYMTWTYGPAGWIDDLNEYIKDPAKTNPNYDWDDVLPACARPPPGTACRAPRSARRDAKQWCIPWGFELNSITYNRKMYDKAGVKPAKNLPELIETAAKLTKDAGRAVRHRRSRLALLGDDPSGLPVRLFQLRRSGTSPSPTAS